MTSAQANQRLDRALTKTLEGLSRSRLKNLIEGGHVERNGEISRQPSQKVFDGDQLTVTVPAAADAFPVGQPMDLKILHEDADLIIIDKPAGLVVHPAPGNPDHTLVNALIAHCGGDLTGIGGVRRPGIVHRLDKDTSGVMVAAKTAEAHTALVKQFSNRTVDRSYRAIVWGQPTPPADKIEGAIGRHPRNRKKMAVVSGGGKPALTRYRSLAQYSDGLATLIECKLETGRTHQIRVHLTHRKHPIVGDQTYGRLGSRRALAKEAEPEEKTTLTAFPRQALHAFRLGFIHPKTQQHIDFETDFPKDMQKLKDFLESL